MSAIVIARGFAADRDHQIVDSNGNVYGGSNASPFLSSDTLTATVSTGQNFPSLFSPVATWVDATGIASYQLAFAAAQTAALSGGTYYGQTSVRRGSDDPGVVGNWQLKITRAPGTDVVPLTFTTTEHLRQYAPWIENLQGQNASEGFIDEQLRATTGLIDLLCNTWKSSSFQIMAGQPGWNASTLFGASAGSSPSFYLRQQLTPQAVNSGAGMLPANTIEGTVGNPNIYTALLCRAWVIEYCAKMAIAYICAAQPPRGDKGESYWSMARMFTRQAEDIALANRAEVDLATPQTGWSSITIPLGSTSVR